MYVCVCVCVCMCVTERQKEGQREDVYTHGRLHQNKDVSCHLLQRAVDTFCNKNEI